MTEKTRHQLGIALIQIVLIISLCGQFWWIGFAVAGGFPNGVNLSTYIVVGIMVGFILALSIGLCFTWLLEDE
jgi:hypothetical protein